MTTAADRVPVPPALILACCASERSKYSIDVPFVRSGSLWATDGRIVARMDAGRAADTVGNFPPVDDVFRSAAARCIGAPPIAPFPLLQMAMKGVACRGCGRESRRNGVVAMRADYFIAEKYARLLFSFGAMVRLPPEGTNHPCLFGTPGGIDGLLMPVSHDPRYGIADVVGAEPGVEAGT